MRLLRRSRAEFAWMVVAAAAAVVASAAAAKEFQHSEGDAAVYWVFAKSMWTTGPFHYGLAGTSHGATSPLWTVLLSIVGIGPEPFTAWKIAGLAAWGLACLSAFRLARHITDSQPQALAALALTLIFPALRHYAEDSYETPLFVALVTESVLLTLRVRSGTIGRTGTTAWLGLLSTLPLVRPEGLLVALALGGVGSVRRPPPVRVPLLALILVPGGLFYGWMFAKTGLLIPSSVSARQLLAAMHDSYLAPVSAIRLINRCFGVVFQGQTLTWEASGLLQAAAICGGMASLVQSNRAFIATYLILAGSFATLMLFNNPGYYLERYACPLAPMGFTLMTHGWFAAFAFLKERLRSHRRPVAGLAYGAIGLAGLALCGPPVRSVVNEAIAPPEVGTDVLDRSGAAMLNQILVPTDVVLVYEIQTAYYVRAKMVSADGIVGGEILPFLKRGNLEDFLDADGVTHVLVSGAYSYRSIFRNTILEDLFVRDPTVSTGATVKVGHTFFAKLAARPRSINTAQWSALYRVVRHKS